VSSTRITPSSSYKHVDSPSVFYSVHSPQNFSPFSIYHERKRLVPVLPGIRNCNTKLQCFPALHPKALSQQLIDRRGQFSVTILSERNNSQSCFNLFTSLINLSITILPLRTPFRNSNGHHSTRCRT
jgi:hypothetical protein